MRRPHQTAGTLETYSPAEEQFNRRRRTAGLVIGPLLCVTVLALPSALPVAAHRLSAVMALMIVLWMTEALPLAVTAIAGPMLAVLLGVASAGVVFAPFADPIIFLFIGSFILAEAMFVHGVDRRIAYTALSWRAVGSSSGRLLVVYGGVTAALSMWMSNTATTAMMFPIGLSIVAHLTRTGTSGARQFALIMMLMTSFAASIGGIGTPVGTPPKAQRLKILVADDVQDAVHTLGMGLQILGHEVRTASNGAEALEIAAAFRPDLAILDIGMPELDGYEVARRIRKAAWGHEMRLVALTGWGQEKDRERSKKAGFRHHLVKPVDVKAIERPKVELRPASSCRHVDQVASVRRECQRLVNTRRLKRCVGWKQDGGSRDESRRGT